MRPFHLSMPVADLDRTPAWYADVLGCAPGRTGADWADLDFFGHQLSLHLVAGYEPDPRDCLVDGVAVPVRHLGVVLDPDAWRDLADRIEDYLITPRSRFEGEASEQHTFFVTDPSGNAVEIKAFPDGRWT